MARMPTFEEIKADFEAGVRTAEQRTGHPFRRGQDTPGADPYPQTPAAQPVNLAPAAAGAATPQEDTMSLITDIEDGWNAAKTELGKFEQALPGALAKAKQFEASPFAQLAEKAAGTVLPPEAVTIAVNAADKVLDDLIGLYGPQAGDPATDSAPAGQQPAAAPAQ